MPRLRNVKTGAVVHVDDDLAAVLEGYEPADSAAGEDKPKRGPGRPRKTD